ncbi:hypothetical protein Dda_7334 [Drechslerella dactyloides]|uniref:Uncharacterized protein n=1 Tax=Drechslerella dactyloides TaxID=74499 RepID=A0AAD6IS28_DREDA|nr:hypothetical protein Dda_7334 [Drechslerella dactyloides]
MATTTKLRPDPSTIFSTEFDYEEPELRVPTIEEQSSFRKLAQNISSKLKSHPKVDCQAVTLEWSRKSKSCLIDPRGCFIIEYVNGSFDLLGGIRNEPLYAPAPHPGSTVGWREKPRISATLGGYIKDCASGNLYAVTVGHLLSSKPETAKYEKEATSPAGTRIKSFRKRNLQRLEDPSRSEVEREMVPSRFNTQTVAEQADYYNVKDIALIRPAKPCPGRMNMTGQHIGFSAESRFIRGHRTAQDSVRVRLHSSMTQYCRGTIRGETLVRFQEFDKTKATWLRTIKRYLGARSRAGDSGAWITDGRSVWVGMVIAGLSREDTGSNNEHGAIEFTRSLFIDSEDILTWAQGLLGEKFEVEV